MSNDIKISLIYAPTNAEWDLCKRCALVTVDKKMVNPPTLEWKKKILKANHSPIRVLNFCFLIENVPYWVSTHLVRHIHAVPFVKSQRNDRQTEYDRKSAPQEAPVNMMWYMNAEELITISHKRLCKLASKETREVVSKALRLVEESYPEFEGLFVPMCEYLHGCPEMNGCGRYR